MTNPSCFHSFPNDNHVDDAGTQTTEWMNMSQFFTFHKAISNEWTCQLLQEEDEMGRECDVVHFHSKHSKSIKNSHKSQSTTQPTLVEKTKVRNHIDKLVPIHLVSTFPPFHLHLLVHPMQFSIYSLHDVADTLKNPTNLFRTWSKVCHFFSISSPNFIHSNNQPS